MMREVVADAPSLAENGARPVRVSICVANAENRAKVLLRPIRDGDHERALRAARRTIVSGLLQRPSKAAAGAGGAALSARATRVLRGKPVRNVSLLVNRRQRSMRREVVGEGKGMPSSSSRERAVIERRSRRTGETARRLWGAGHGPDGVRRHRRLPWLTAATTFNEAVMDSVSKSWHWIVYAYRAWLLIH